jgi:hypothetical protein
LLELFRGPLEILLSVGLLAHDAFQVQLFCLPGPSAFRRANGRTDQCRIAPLFALAKLQELGGRPLHGVFAAGDFVIEPRAGRS